MAPSAPARLTSANRRAFCAVVKPKRADSERMTPPYSPSGCDCQKIAAFVSSAVRVVLENEPIDFTSLRSRAYALLVSAFGPCVRSISALGTRNGFTLPTHGVGSGVVSGGDTRQTPGVVPNTKGNG